ncbi:MAG: HD domain-containing protein, partial [Clostridia bacterium]|nr:HD domain-containing protein [Clostridia bacterium]
MITINDIKSNPEVQALVKAAQNQLDAIGYTEHSERHITIVSNRCAEILEKLGYDDRIVELGKIAGYLHDIGNAVNRIDHAHSGAILANQILKEIRMPAEDRMEILTAIGNHDEDTGTAVSDISAALILADKSDVHRSRVRNQNMSTFDIHDRVNYAVTDADLEVYGEERKIKVKLTIDTNICPVLDYFQIFMERTMMSKYAA